MRVTDTLLQMVCLLLLCFHFPKLLFLLPERYSGYPMLFVVLWIGENHKAFPERDDEFRSRRAMMVTKTADPIKVKNLSFQIKA